MPAGSELRAPQLPHTWRPLGVRLAIAFFGTMLVAVCIAAWFAVGADVRAKVTVYQQATVVVLALMGGAVAWGLLRCRVTASPIGLEVVNGYRTHRYEWAEVLGVHLPQGAPFPTLDLADGTSRPALGIQASDGDRARRAVAELRLLLAATSGRSLQRPDTPAD